MLVFHSQWDYPKPQHHYVEAHKDYKYILTWSHAYDDPNYGLTSAFSGFQQCREPRCYLTSDREHLGEKVLYKLD